VSGKILAAFSNTSDVIVNLCTVPLKHLRLKDMKRWVSFCSTILVRNIFHLNKYFASYTLHDYTNRFNRLILTLN
jgi:hypothetical protein